MLSSAHKYTFKLAVAIAIAIVPDAAIIVIWHESCFVECCEKGFTLD